MAFKLENSATGVGNTITSLNRYDLLHYMKIYGKDEEGNDKSLWKHEWGKHDTCISTFDPSPTREVEDYFQ